MKFDKKKIAVIGLGITGKSLIKFLLTKKAKVTGCDQKKEIDKEIKKLPINLSLGKKYLENLDKFDLIFISPGIPHNILPLKDVRDKISSETQLFFEHCKAPIIGITGTNGKTTTTYLTSKILQQGNKKVFTGGNIGNSLINKLKVIRKNDLVLLELSSFQIENLNKSPHIAVLLNITPDHLDRYHTFNDYKKVKEYIFKFQNKRDFCILNYDDNKVRPLKNKVRSSVLFFSVKKPLKCGAFLKNNEIIIKSKKISKIIRQNDIKIPGKHNIENILAASLIGHLCKINPDKIKKVIRKFKGIPHRLELIRSLKQIDFYNDSKATTPESTIAALNAFNKPIILIAGGYDKKANYNSLVKIIDKKAKLIVLIGQTAKDIAKECKKQKIKNKVTFARNLEEAVLKAYKVAEKKDIVLLSPACASYDMFKNYEERGNVFKKIVKSFK